MEAASAADQRPSSRDQRPGLRLLLGCRSWSTSRRGKRALRKHKNAIIECNNGTRTMMLHLPEEHKRAKSKDLIR